MSFKKLRLRNISYYISDHLGTPQLVVDAEGQVVWQGDYLPFGEVTVTADEVGNSIRFPGQYFDAETGLHYNWHRFYDPSTGRYISADPIGMDGGINLYVYVVSDPVNAVDLAGENAALVKAVYEVWDKPYNDLYKHCYVSCKGNKMDGAEYAPFNAQLTNIQLAVVEVLQTAGDMDFRNPYDTFQSAKEENWDRDMPSNRAGYECAKDCEQSCEECCSKYAGGKGRKK